MKPKILFSDFDGTIFTGDDTTAKNLEAIKKFRAAGHKFVIATGRSYVSIKRELANHPIPYDYLVVNNGALIADQEDAFLLYQTIPPDLAESIVAHAKTITAIDSIYYYGLNHKTETPGPDLTKIRINTPGKSHAPAEKLAQNLNQHFRRSIKAHRTSTDLYPELNYQIVDIVNYQAGKDTAISFILAREQLTSSDATSVGDGPNDIDMLTHFNGYALDSSDPAVLEVVTKTTSSVADLISDMLK